MRHLEFWRRTWTHWKKRRKNTESRRHNQMLSTWLPSKKSSLREILYQNTRRKTCRLKRDWNSNKDCTKLFVLTEILIAKISLKPRTRSPKSREDTKLSTIRSANWRSKSMPRRLLWRRKEFNTRRKIKLLKNTPGCSRNTEKKLQNMNKKSKVSTVKH